MTTTPLPPPGNAGIEDHTQMSYRLLDQARQELALDDRIQASEKAWGAAAHALKAIAVQRGWQHYSHAHVNAIGEQLGREFGRDHFLAHIAIANGMHRNFYENDAGRITIGHAIDGFEGFIVELEELLNSPPRPFVVEDDGDQHRLALLLGLPRDRLPSIGARSEVGFSRTHPEHG